MKYPLILSFLMLSAMVNAQQRPTVAGNGKLIFETHCSKCHGADGARGRFGAKDLRKSVLNDEAYFAIISEGRRFMPRWKNKLTDAERMAVIAYIKTLKS
jgi:cytochrome c6